MYVRHMLLLALYMRIAMSCSRRFCRVDSPAIDMIVTDHRTNVYHNI